jgi:hypothetical protein
MSWLDPPQAHVQATVPHHAACVTLCRRVAALPQMMELDWPREVLRLGPCKEVKAPDGSLVYRWGQVLLVGMRSSLRMLWIAFNESGSDCFT